MRALTYSTWHLCNTITSVISFCGVNFITAILRSRFRQSPRSFITTHLARASLLLYLIQCVTSHTTNPFTYSARSVHLLCLSAVNRKPRKCAGNLSLPEKRNGLRRSHCRRTAVPLRKLCHMHGMYKIDSFLRDLGRDFYK